MDQECECIDQNDTYFPEFNICKKNKLVTEKTTITNNKQDKTIKNVRSITPYKIYYIGIGIVVLVVVCLYFYYRMRFA